MKDSTKKMCVSKVNISFLCCFVNQVKYVNIQIECQALKYSLKNTNKNFFTRFHERGSLCLKPRCQRSVFDTLLKIGFKGHFVKNQLKIVFKGYLSKMVRSRGSLKSQTFLKETLIRLIWCLPCISQQVQIQEIA